MPVDPDYIELLVLEEISGVISTEDRKWLMEQVKTDPAAKAIWDELHAQLPAAYIEKLQHKLSTELSPDAIIEKIRERQKAKRRKQIRDGAIYLVAASILLLVITIIIFHTPAQKEPQLVADLRYASLQIPGKEIFSLQNRIDTFNLGSSMVYKKDDSLTFDNGYKAIDARVTVPPGSSLFIKLQDNSTIWLNAGSSANFPTVFKGSTREISIKGEAFLNIAKDPQRPFIVNVRNGKIAVLGTSFSINSLDRNKVSVELTRGSIQMRTFQDSLLLSPGQAVTFRQGQPLEAVPFDTTALLNRQKGLYTFNEATVAEIMEELHRIRLVKKEAAIDVDTLRFSGIVNMKAPLSTILEGFKWQNPDFDYNITFNGKDSIIHLIKRVRQ